MLMSPRRCAQVGLGAAGLVLVSSLAILVNGASEVPAKVVGVARTHALPNAVIRANPADSTSAIGR